MASSQNLASLDPWAFRTSFADSWISEAFVRDTEALTKALQKSLSCQSETLTSPDANSSFLNLIKPEVAATPTGSGSDLDTAAKRRSTIATATATGKISKRKSRASKRSPTTFITADPANFRQMVQEVTGIRFPNSHLPVSPVLKPEPQRPVTHPLQSCLPMLDTSALLLDHHHQNQLRERQPNVMGVTSRPQAQVSTFSPSESVDGAAAATVGMDFGSFHGAFPTLESWRVM